MSETTSTPVGHEAYAFACMRCGHGWEQAYEIEHHTDISGHEFVVYKAEGGRRVPSPLSNPTCANCGGHLVRIMRAGQVSSVLELLAQHQAAPTTGTVGSAGPTLTQERQAPPPDGPAAATEPHRWHLSDLLHAFHRK
ncbi:hypothetical protein [Streptomyces sp. NPDC015131]|uniref:hypothetical protein n=1 Tax=Streptomyces sp. NPDC015131 TaxID=3364941 RepID=UPI0036FB6E82